jgi:hypothetical protein
MALSKRHLVLAATATTLGIGGVLLPGASAMAATPEQSVAVEASASDSTSTTTEASSAQPDTVCVEEWYVDAYGNWYYVWVCV